MPDITHIAFIMDGNRRFAKRLMLEPWKGHEYGRDKFREVIGWLKEAGVHEATFYAFSLENLKRPAKEFEYLMKLFSEAFDQLADDQTIDADGLRIRFAGDLSVFPEQIQVKAQKLQQRTANNDGYILNVAFGYGGRQEIVKAVQQIGHKITAGELDAGAIDEQTIAAHLCGDSEPDLIVRTGGERRTSNFLPWQSVYSEWFFIDKAWPEFTKEDFEAVLDQYEHRQRRFGK